LIKTINFRTLGCRLNHAESDSIQYGLHEAGYRVVGEKTAADLTIINSCAVTQQAEAKTRGAIAAARRISPHGKIAVIGCYSQLSPEILADLKGVDLVLGNSEKYRIQELLDVLEKGQKEIHVSKPVSGDTFPPVGLISKGSRTRAHVKVQEGCDYRCAYCIIPLLRGSSRSRSFRSCIDEVLLLSEQGVKEIVLSGINIGTYRDGGRDFSDLVSAILSQSDIERLRISSIEPDLVSDRLIEFMRNEPRICRHFHIPLQHGSNEVLGWMRRRYKAELFAGLVHKLSQKIPGVCIGTDVLVGFPGETEEHFREMTELLELLPLAYFHVFRYSARPGTAAAGLSDSVPVKIKKERSQELRKLSDHKRNHFLRQFKGEDLSVLIEKKTKLGLYRGLSDNYITVNVKSDKQIVNSIKTIRVHDIDSMEVQGELIGG